MHRFGLREICPDDFVIGFFKRYHIPQTEGAAGIVGERGDRGANRINSLPSDFPLATMNGSPGVGSVVPTDLSSPLPAMQVH